MIIGLVGGKGAGKNTVAAYLSSRYGATTYSIANELKELLRHMFGLSQAQLHGTQLEKEAVDHRWGFSARELMECQGDALRHVYGDTFQVNRVLSQIAHDSPRVAVISDVRYAHEAVRVRLQGVLWRLRYAPGLHLWPSEHSSEQEWTKPDVDLEITPGAKGTLELEASVDQACKIFGII